MFIFYCLSFLFACMLFPLTFAQHNANKQINTENHAINTQKKLKLIELPMVDYRVGSDTGGGYSKKLYTEWMKKHDKIFPKYKLMQKQRKKLTTQWQNREITSEQKEATLKKIGYYKTKEIIEEYDITRMKKVLNHNNKASFMVSSNVNELPKTIRVIFHKPMIISEKYKPVSLRLGRNGKHPELTLKKVERNNKTIYTNQPAKPIVEISLSKKK